MLLHKSACLFLFLKAVSGFKCKMIICVCVRLFPPPFSHVPPSSRTEMPDTPLDLLQLPENVRAERLRVSLSPTNSSPQTRGRTSRASQHLPMMPKRPAGTPLALMPFLLFRLTGFTGEKRPRSKRQRQIPTHCHPTRGQEEAPAEVRTRGCSPRVPSQAGRAPSHRGERVGVL